MTTITLIADGPLKLESDSIIVHENGNELKIPNVCALCRCGQTKKGPFCDGTHELAGFSSKREIEVETIQSYSGKRIGIQFNRSICSGAGRCVKRLPAVFSEASSDHWIFPDNDSIENIQKVIDECPSSALSLQIGNDIVKKDSLSKQRIDIVSNGPLIVQGVELVDRPHASHSDASRYALCRCGLSKNKPYCDYSHAQFGWKERS